MRPGFTLHIGVWKRLLGPLLLPGDQIAAAHARRVFHRRLTCIVFVVVGLVGSPGLASAGPVIVETEDTGGGAGVVLTANQRTADRLFDEVFTRQTPDVCALLMVANAVTHTPAGDFHGPTGFEQYVAGFWTDYPDAEFAIDAGIAHDDQVTLHWKITGEQTNRLDGLAILRFEQGMIAESWIEYADTAPADRVDPNVAPELCPPCREP